MVREDRIRPLRRTEYDRLVEMGVFQDEKVELLNGRMVRKSPQGGRHAFVIVQLTKLLIQHLGARAEVRVQLPLAASDDSEPEPDLALVPLGGEKYEHPRSAHLVIEVADSSLELDREVKAALYAAMGVPEYWIVNVIDNLVERHTEPHDGHYLRVEPAGADAVLTLVAFPDVKLNARDFLPL